MSKRRSVTYVPFYANNCLKTRNFTLTWDSWIHLTTYYSGGRDTAVGIATGYGMDGPGIESRWGKFFRVDKNGPETHPTSCTMGTGSLPGVKRPECNVNHPRFSSAGLRKGTSYNSTTPPWLHRHVIRWPLPFLHTTLGFISIFRIHLFLGIPNGVFSWRFPDQHYLCISHFTHTCNLSAHLPLLNYIIQTVLIKQLAL